VIARRFVGHVGLHAISAIPTIVAHIQTSFRAQTTVSGVMEDASRVLRVVTQIVPTVEVPILGVVARVKRAGVKGLHRDDSGAAVL
jgi:GTPase